MRKTFIFALSFLVVMTLVQINNFKLISNKIIYEFNNSKTDLSTEDVKEYLNESGKVHIVTHFQYDTFKIENNLPRDATMEEVDEYKEQVFKLGKKYHKNQNEKIASTLDLIDYESCYIAEYLPFAEYVFEEETFVNNIEEILSKFTSNGKVKKVYVRNNINNTEDKIIGSLHNTNAYDMWNDGDVSGSGVKIGMIETGYPDFTHVNLDSVVHQVQNLGPTVTATEHATVVANIICGEEGVAYGASLYCTGIYGTNVVNEYDWITARGVDIVNLSYGEVTPTSSYTSDAALADYMVYAYDIIACAAVGNSGTGNGKIGSPGTGYNVIGVGSAAADTTVTNYSSYNEMNLGEKPTVIVPGNNIYIDNVGTSTTSYSGTSFACAMATGLIALLLNKYPVLKTNAMEVVALVCANSGINSFFPQDQGNGFNEYEGAGFFDFARIDLNIGKTTAFYNLENELDNMIYEWDIYISANKTIRACFAWCARPNTTNNTAIFNRYDVIIRDANGNILAQSTNTKDNVVMATAVTPSKGTYYIQLYQRTDYYPNTTGDYICFSYRYR